VLLSDLYPAGDYPEGEVLLYNENTQRTTGEEIRYQERQATFDDAFLKDYRQAACAHRQVRQWAQKEILKPGNTLYDIAESIEDGVRALVGHQGLEPHDAFKAGIAFPTGLCLNNTAAHSTPTPGGKKVVLQYEDVMAVDFGVHVNGRIVDSAFTVAFDPAYDNLLAAVKAATNTGVKVSSLCHLHDNPFLFHN
jgi:methionyl aminopeptidase